MYMKLHVAACVSLWLQTCIIPWKHLCIEVSQLQNYVCQLVCNLDYIFVPKVKFPKWNCFLRNSAQWSVNVDRSYPSCHIIDKNFVLLQVVAMVHTLLGLSFGPAESQPPYLLGLENCIQLLLPSFSNLYISFSDGELFQISWPICSRGIISVSGAEHLW